MCYLGFLCKFTSNFFFNSNFFFSVGERKMEREDTNASCFWNENVNSFTHPDRVMSALRLASAAFKTYHNF